MSVSWDDSKERVRAANEIVDVIGSYLTLSRQGRNYVGLCPWHDDSRPSFQVNPERQSWRCWVCDLGGDVFSFVMKHQSVEFREALELLADRAGIDLPRRGRSAPGQDKRSLFQLMAWAEREFHEYLMRADQAQVARDYLLNRGITEESIKRFRIGFSPDSWDWLRNRARKAYFTDDQLAATGLTSVGQGGGSAYDRFRHRVLFSIRDPQGKTVGFGGRVLPNADEKAGAKYVNSPETKLFSKSDLLYALDIVRDEVAKSRKVIVVEGYTDAIMVYQQGVKNVVAVLGTALTESHIRLLRRYCDRVTLVLDGDEAGQRRTNEVLQLFLQHAVDLRIATLPTGDDPCDFVSREGAEGFQQLVESARGAMDHKVHTATVGVDLARDLYASNKALEEILSVMALVSKSNAADMALIQLKESQLLANLSRRFDVAESELRQRLTALRRTKPVMAKRSAATPSGERPELDEWDRALLELFVRHPECVPTAVERLCEDDLKSESARALFRIYRDRGAENASLAFHDVMLAVEAPGLKSLLVELDEQAAKKAELSKQPKECFDAVLAAFDRRQKQGESRQHISRIENENLSEEEQFEALAKILNNQRSRQGL